MTNTIGDQPPVTFTPFSAVRVFGTGAVRSSDADRERFDLISPIAMRALAEVCDEGARKYGDFNWEAGMPAHDLLNHAIRHIFMFLAGDKSEPHLPHAFWGIGAAIHSLAVWPALNAGTLRGPGCRPPTRPETEPKPEPERPPNAAMVAATREPRTVYVAGPYRVPDPATNTNAAIRAADELWDWGFSPYVPHLTLLWNTVSPRPEAAWLEHDTVWLRKCDAVLRMPGFSSGADAEVAEAVRRGIPVFHDVESLVQYFGRS